jgi:hypothetical protein
VVVEVAEEFCEAAFAPPFVPVLLLPVAISAEADLILRLLAGGGGCALSLEVF